MKRYKFLLVFFLICTTASLCHGQSISDLKDKIESGNATIKQLEQEIQGYQREIDTLGKEKDTLNNTLKSLDLSKKKLQADTKITERKISDKNLEIQALTLQIGDKNDRITDGQRLISQALRTIFQSDSTSVFENLLNQSSLSEFWNGIDELATLQSSMHTRIQDLTHIRLDLENNKKQIEQKKSELITLTDNLKNQTKIVAETVAEKNSILAETKNTEANYKSLLATKKAQKEAFEREVDAYESALKIAIDPHSIPSTGSGVLKYPLATIRITQYFGNTDFATKNPQIYSSGTHNGVDFAASIGTPIKSALGGIVVGTGNTDVGKCYSYGKWIMIKHPNGLSTLYAHLSLIGVTEGQTVSTGEIIGYSGKTGAATGPHLHFGVYATEGVNISINRGSKYCGTVKIPYASLSAYLNPLSFL